MSRKLLDVPGSTAELRQARVFISYARLDTELVEPVVKALADRGVKILRDVEDLLPTEKWRARLVGMISEADAALFFISPNFADSEVCAWEAQTAHSLAKRLVPIRIDDVAAAGLPEILSELNWLSIRPDDNLLASVDRLIQAIDINIDWVREHTRIGLAAGHWEKANRPSSLLLRGTALNAAEAWLAGRPPRAPVVTSLQQQFVVAGRKASSLRSQIVAMIACAVAAVTLGLAYLAYLSEQQALSNLRVAEARRFGTLATQALNEGFPQRAALLAATAIQSTERTGERVSQANEALRQVLGEVSGDVLTTLQGWPTAFATNKSLSRIAVGELLQSENLSKTIELTARISVRDFDSQGSLQLVCELALGDQAITKIAFSEKGSMLIAATSSSVYRVSVNSKKCRVAHESRLGYVGEVSFGDDTYAVGPRARMLAVEGSWDNEIVLLDAAGDRPPSVLGRLSGRVTSAAFSADAELLVVGSQMSDASDDRDDASVLAIAELTSRGGSLLQHMITIRRARDEKLGGIGYVAIADHANQRFVFAGHESGALGVLSLPSESNESPAPAVQEWRHANGLNAPHGASTQIKLPNGIDAIVPHLASGLILTGHSDGTLTMWRINLSTGSLTPVSRVPLGKTSLRHLAYDPGSQTIVAAARNNSSLDSSLHACVVGRDTVSACRSLVGHEKPVVGIAIMPSGGAAVSVAEVDPTVRSWSLGVGGGRTLAYQRVLGAAHDTIHFNYSGSQIYVGPRNLPENSAYAGNVFRYHTKSESTDARPIVASSKRPLQFFSISANGRWILKHAGPYQKKSPSEAELVLEDLSKSETSWSLSPRIVPGLAELTIANDGRTVAGYDRDRRTIIIARSADETTWQSPESNHINGIVFSDNGDLFFAFTADGDVWVWNVDTKSAVRPPTRIARKIGDIRSMAVTSDSRRLAAVGYDAKAWIWDLECLHSDRCSPFEISAATQLRNVKFSPDGRILVSGSVTGDILLWSLASGSVPGAPVYLRGHDGDVKDIGFSPDGRFLVSGSFSYSSTDNTVRIWDLTAVDPGTSVEELIRGDVWFKQVLFAPDGRSVLARDDEGALWAWSVVTSELAIRAKSFAGREYTTEELRRFFPDG